MATLSGKFEEAFQFAAEVHRHQKRKGTDVPYLTHLMSVAALVGEHGGDEEQMIAGLLHDAMEDQGITRQQIEGRFGKRVADIVDACTDSTEQPKPPWRQRKARYIEHLRTASPDIKLVSAADKLHNACSILSDLRVHGPALWSRFTVGSAEGVLWYFRGLVEAFRQGWSHPVIDELEQTVRQIEKLNDALKIQRVGCETSVARPATPVERPLSIEKAGTRDVRIEWEGPFSVQDILRLNDNDQDYGLYQIYGRHVIFGPGALLYIGIARDQTLATRFRQHQAEWLTNEEGVAVRVGRIVSGDYAHEPPNWPDWCQLLTDAEALEIYSHAPPYNASNISEYKGQPLRIINIGERGSLLAECESAGLQPRPKDASDSSETIQIVPPS